MKSHSNHLSVTDQATVETIIERFEVAWHAGAFPQLEDFIPEDDALHNIVLIELVHSDLDFRIKAGEKVRAEEYFQRFLNLQNDDDVFCELVEAEYQLRQQQEPLLKTVEYWQRFPNQHKLLRQIFPDSSMTETLIYSPEQFGRYSILQTLGEGAMGTVFLAEDQELKRQVALKFPKFSEYENGETLERFYQEARSAASLQHPNICPIFDIGIINEKHYISMGYIEGKPLSEYIGKSQPFPQSEVVKIIRTLAIALQEAHNQGVIHRDLKPANIMIDKKGDPVIMDFGLARQIDSENKSRLTQPLQVIGSPAYMSPEQMQDSATVGPSSDIHSLGTTFYQLLTGLLPFRGSSSEVRQQVLFEEPTPPSEICKEADPVLEQICLQMIHKQISQRPTSMQEVADELNKWLMQNDPETKTKRLTWTALVAVSVLLLAVVYFAFNNSSGSIKVKPANSVLDVLVWNPDSTTRRRQPLFAGGALPVQPEDKIRVEARLSGDMYAYVIWIGCEGDATPLYPWNPADWSIISKKQLPVRSISLPADSTAGWSVTGPTGTETILLLERKTPLPDNVDLQKLFAGLPKLSEPLRSQQSMIYLADGRLLMSEMDKDRGLNTIDVSLNDSVLERQQQIYKMLKPHFEKIMSVSFTHQAE